MFQISRLWRVHFLRFHLSLSILGCVAFSVWVFRFGGLRIVDPLLNGNRSAVYGTLAQISGTLLGFVITALSIIIGYSSSEKFDFLRKSRHYHTLWEVLLSTIKVLSITTVWMIIGLVVDRDKSPVDFIVCMSIFFILLSGCRLYKSLRVFENVIAIIIK